jgi:hypothetical protein
MQTAARLRGGASWWTWSADAPWRTGERGYLCGCEFRTFQVVLVLPAVSGLCSHVLNHVGRGGVPQTW